MTYSEDYIRSGVSVVAPENLGIEPQGESEAREPEPTLGDPSPVIRDVTIKQLNFGYTVKVGCHSFAIETKEKLLTALGDYLKDPQGIEKEWFEGRFLK